MPLRGTLHINPLFNRITKDIPDESLDKWKKDLENANLLIKCIQQRNNTMQRLMSYLANFQRNFILKGDHHLRPTTRAAISRILEVHESTISRAVSGKCMQLPSGRIIPISMLFDRSLPIRAHLKDLIRSEKHPYTDSQLVTMLADKGYTIARRTVAKYRTMEGILPAHLRKTN
jgi:RNA polymerase sigma-54 factor